MGYSKYVGRVGALALTLGIGTAVATPAWAEPSNPDSSSSASESPQKPSPRRGGAAESSGPTSDPRNDAGQSDTGSDTAADTSSEDGDREVNEAELVEDEKPTVAGSADEPTELVADEINETSPASIVDSDSSTSASAPSSADTAKVTASLDPSTADDVVAERPADHPHQKAAVVSDGLAGDQAATASYALTAIPPSDTPAPSPLIRQPSSPVGVLLGGPVALLEIAGKALNMLFNPDPTAPGDSPLLLGVLAFVRREIQRTFFNSSPNAAADVASTSEGIGTRISVLDNDTDPNPGDVLTITDYTQAANGVVTLNADGSFAYTPEDGFSGTDTFTYTVSDEASGWHGHFAGLLQRHTSTATVSITVKPAPVNESPTAADDSATTAEDTPVLIDAAANDSDPDGDDITILNVGTAQHGTVAVLDGRITYTPGLNFHGTDSFDYTITDGSLSDTATVTITVTPANDAPVANVDTATVAGNSVANVIDVLANDTDVDTADTLSVAVVGVPTRGGTVAINDGNTLSYTPAAGFSGTETFTYAVSDGTATSVGTVTVVVSPMIPVNQAPIAVDDAATTSANTPIVITPLANDTDPDGDTLTLTTVSDTLNGGTVTINGTTLTYTPATNHTGSDTFSYTVTDGKITDTATVTITINPGSLITPVGTVTTLDAAGVQSILGITHSPEGTLLITAKDSNGEAFLGTVDADGSVVRLAELSGLPYGVAVGPGGRIYVTDGETGAITSFDPAEGYTSEIVATLVDDAYGLAFDEEGNLYVTTNRLDSGVSTPVGQLTILKADGSTETVALPGGSIDVHIGPDGRIYAGYYRDEGGVDGLGITGGVLILDDDGVVEDVKLPGVVPTGIAVAADGTLFIGDGLSERLVVRYPNAVTRSLDTGDQPFGLSFDTAGNLHIVAMSSNTITVLDPLYSPTNTGGPSLSDSRPYTILSGGVVYGQLIGEDPDEDLVLFSLASDIDPTVGSVIVGSASGRTYWLFTPTPEARAAAAEAWNDPDIDNLSVTFTVIGTDGQFSDDISITVDIVPDLPPIVQDPAFTIVETDLDTGRITGQVHVTDPDGNYLDYGLSSEIDWDMALVYVDNYSGTWFFEPTSQARNAALSTPEADEFTFVISATDGTTEIPITITVPVLPAAPFQQYTTFDGTTLELFAYRGERTMILANSATLDPETMQAWLDAMDEAYAFYMSATGREPITTWSPTYIDGRATIARVPSTCGAGCGYLGFTGIEILDEYFDYFYDRLSAHDQYDQVPFYEFGRNFWFYSDKLEYLSSDPVVTGYAVFMRSMSMEHLGLDGAPFNGDLPFDDFEDQVRSLREIYLADPSLNWGNTLGVGQGVPFDENAGLGATDLFASFCFYLKETYGMQWVTNVWKFAADRPNRVTTQDAVDNFIVAASQAAQTNLLPLFEHWRWPISNDAMSEIEGMNFASTWSLEASGTALTL